VADRNLQQYTADLTAAGQLGQAGRTNLRNTLTNLPNTLTRSVGAFMPTPPSPYSYQQPPQISAPDLGGPISIYQQYKTKIEQDLANRMTGMRNNAFDRARTGVDINRTLSTLRDQRLRGLSSYTGNYPRISFN